MFVIVIDYDVFIFVVFLFIFVVYIFLRLISKQCRKTLLQLQVIFSVKNQVLYEVMRLQFNALFLDCHTGKQGN